MLKVRMGSPLTLTATAAPREVIQGGRRYLVAPVVACVEGVLNRFVYPADRLAESVRWWDGVPLTVRHPRHPETHDFTLVRFLTPDVASRYIVGAFRYPRFDASKRALCGEVWIDVDLALAVDERILSLVREGGRLEVSTGLEAGDDGVAGRWTNGEVYEGTLGEMFPDHLALLPDEVGACDWNDGCGVRAAAEEKREGKMKLRKIVETVREAVSAALDRAAGVPVTWGDEDGAKLAELSNQDVAERVQTAVDALDNEEWAHFVKDTYADHVVYEARWRGSDNPNQQRPTETRKLYRRDYSIGEDEKVALAEEAVEVVEKREYVPARENADGDAKGGTKEARVASAKDEAGDGDPQAGGPSTAKGGKDMNKEKLVNELIACEGCPFGEDDRELLNGLTETRLAVFLEVGKRRLAAEAPESKDEPKTKDEPKPKQAAKQEKPKPKTMEQFIAEAPAEMQGTLRRAVDRDKAIKAELVKKLKANARCKFSEEQLNAKEIEELEALAALADVPVDYSGAGGHEAPRANENEIPAMGFYLAGEADEKKKQGAAA